MSKRIVVMTKMAMSKTGCYLKQLDQTVLQLDIMQLVTEAMSTLLTEAISTSCQVVKQLEQVVLSSSSSKSIKAPNTKHFLATAKHCGAGCKLTQLDTSKRFEVSLIINIVDLFANLVAT